MKKKNLTRKLITSIATATMTAVCLTTTTYAWFSRNENVWIEETDFNIDSYEGLLISLDGKSFSQDVTEEELKKLITGKSTEEEALEAFNELGFEGTTVQQDDSGKIVYDSNKNVIFEHDVVVYEEHKYFNRIKLTKTVGTTTTVVALITVKTDNDEITSITAVDGSSAQLVVNNETDYYSIKDESGNLIANISNITVDDFVRSIDAIDDSGDELDSIITYKNDGYSHSTEVSTANERYLKFDVTFRLISDSDTSDTHKNFALVFDDTTSLKARKTEEVTLQNTMTTQNATLEAGDVVNLDISNAMRLGVYSSYLGGMKTFEVANDMDLGSSAIEGSTESSHMTSTNAMYTYYNSLNSKYPLTSGAVDGERFNTISEYTNTNLGEFKYDSTTGEYNDITLTMYIWLEGWDADYFLGASVDARTILVNLGYTYKEI